MLKAIVSPVYSLLFAFLLSKKAKAIAHTITDNHNISFAIKLFIMLFIEPLIPNIIAT